MVGSGDNRSLAKQFNDSIRTLTESPGKYPLKPDQNTVKTYSGDRGTLEYPTKPKPA